MTDEKEEMAGRPRGFTEISGFDIDKDAIVMGGSGFDGPIGDVGDAADDFDMLAGFGKAKIEGSPNDDAPNPRNSIPAKKSTKIVSDLDDLKPDFEKMD